jgi:beta-glucosidase
VCGSNSFQPSPIGDGNHHETTGQASFRRILECRLRGLSQRHFGRFVSILIFVCANCLPVAAQQSMTCTQMTCAYLNPSLRPEVRAKDLVSRMTLEEKISQTLSAAPEIPRLGVPAYGWCNEALHGVAFNGAATTFPQAIGVAATWDASLMKQLADAIGTEGRAKYNDALRHNDRSCYAGLTFWSPNINIFRDPRWGRGQETYGEDPFLTGRMGIAFIRGLQGDDPRYLKAVATPKHFAVHSGPEPLRHKFSADVSPYDLEDTYLPAFRSAIVEGHAQSIMCAYSAVDDVPACASGMLLKDHLRDAWKFRGYVVSDCDAINNIVSGHHFAPDYAHGAAVAMQAGDDLDCGGTYKNLGDAVRLGLLQESELDQSVARLFTARIRLGMFDPPDQVPFNKILMSAVDSAAHRQLALQAARESIVLLQNRSNLLPLHHVARIAVVGPTAEIIETVEGNYSAAAPHPVRPLDGIRQKFKSATISYSAGSILVDGLRATVPSTVLHPSADSMTAGLKGEYFDNLTFSGRPKLVRTDSNISFNWSYVPPADSFGATQFSVRWTGVIVPPGAGQYTFGFRGGPFPNRKPAAGSEVKENATVAPVSSLRIYLDGKAVIDTAAGAATAELTFPDAKPHALQIDYVRVTAARDGDDHLVSFDWLPPAQPLLDHAIASAKSSDVVIAFVGLSPHLEGEEMKIHVDGFDGGDRTDIALPAVQEKLLEALKATGKPLVVVLTSGSAVAVNWADRNADALLEAWYGGEEAGTAIAETLAGDSNPSGKLPVTFYRDVRDLPPFANYSMRNRTYRYFDGPVLYPFGYGLSYSQFKYEVFTLSSSSIAAGDSFTASVAVRNTSARAGDAVAEVYIKAPGTILPEHSFLSGFARVHLAAGQTKHITIPINARELSRVDEAGKRRILAGEYTISVGGGQPQFGQDVHATLEVNGTANLEK